MTMPEQTQNQNIVVSLARAHLAMHRKRDALLGSDLFAEPAWEILLTLIAQDAERHSLEGVLSQIPLPRSTVMRWISILAARNLIDVVQEDMDETTLGLKPSARAEIAKVLAGFAD
jgi:hypothetical protein